MCMCFLRERLRVEVARGIVRVSTLDLGVLTSVRSELSSERSVNKRTRLIAESTDHIAPLFIAKITGSR